jgi:type I restriction enzyme, S subunit
MSAPSGWAWSKVKHTAQFFTGWTPPTGVSENFEGDNLWANISDLGPKVLSNTSKRISDEAIERSAISKTPAGSVLFSFKLSIGQVSFAGTDLYTNEAIASFPPQEGLNTRWAYWAFPIFIPENAGENIYGAKLLNQELIRSADILLPPPDEQEQIANFLDDKTARIDALIAEKERLVERILEYRQSVATTAVTQGVPGEHLDLVPHSFLGPIPKSWRAGKFRHYVQFRSGQVDPEADSYLDMPLIAPNHIESGTGRLIEIQSSRDQAAESGKYWCDSGDVIYSKIRPALRKATLAPFDCLCSADMYPLKGQSGLSNSYLFWYLLSEPFSNFAVQESVRVAMPKLNRETLAGAFVPLPPPEEQDRIVSFIEEKISAIDQVVENAKEHLTRLREYRSSLISAAVTGQLDITNYETEAV